MKKRSVERIPANLRAEFIWSEKLNTGSIADLSEKGVLFKTVICPPLKANFDLNISVEDDVLKVPVKVRRLVKKDRSYEAVGLEILNPPQKYLDFVSDLRWERIRGIKTNGQIIKLYVCKACHHISFDHAPIHCPICSSTIESFEKAPEAIKRPDDFSELSEFEKNHIPVIKIIKENGYINAHIKVGEIEHGSDIDDHISFIDIYYNSPFIHKKCISRVNFNCEKMHPSASLRFNNESKGVLTVVSKCSAHGNWLARASI